MLYKNNHLMLIYFITYTDLPNLNVSNKRCKFEHILSVNEKRCNTDLF